MGTCFHASSMKFSFCSSVAMGNGTSANQDVVHGAMKKDPKTPNNTLRKSVQSTPSRSAGVGPMADFLKGVTLKKTDGSTKLAEEALKGKVVGLYFSAHWCPPCRQFTPVLKDFYGELEDGGEFEIIFVSFDRSADDLKKYLDECHGDWYHIPFGSDKIQELASKFGVSGIPALIIVKPDGKEVTKNGRADVQGKAPAAALAGWKNA